MPIPVATIGPIFRYTQPLETFSLGTIGGVPYELSDDVIYENLAPFAFP